MGFGGRTPSAMIPLPFISISRLLREAEGTVFARADIARPDHAAHDYIFVLIIHKNLPLCLDYEIAIWKNGDYLAGKAGGEGGIGCCRSLALKHR